MKMSVKTYGLQKKRKYLTKRPPLKTINGERRVDPFDELSSNVFPRKAVVAHGDYDDTSSSLSSSSSSGSGILFKSIRINEDVPFLQTSLLPDPHNNINKKTKKRGREVLARCSGAGDDDNEGGLVNWGEIEAFQLVVEKKGHKEMLGSGPSRPRRKVPEPSIRPTSEGCLRIKSSTPKCGETNLSSILHFLENETPIGRTVSPLSTASAFSPGLLDSTGELRPAGDDASSAKKWSVIELKPCSVVLTPLRLDILGLHINKSCRKRCSMFGRKVLPLEKTGTSEKQQVLELCQQAQPLPFSSLIPKKVLSGFEKVGEGTYGEVFRSGARVLKIVPIEGDFEVNSESQKTFQDVLSEIIITRELSELASDDTNKCSNYIHLHRVCCARGRYPKKLLREWKRYARTKESLNDCPDIFPHSQLYILFEFSDGGMDLESYQFNGAAQAKSIVVQIACSLAVAEKALEFEHRDLHWSNVLVRPTTLSSLRYVLGGRRFALPSEGVVVSIIDFTLSRLGDPATRNDPRSASLTLDGCAIYTDLSEDPSFFEGSGDYQFDIYRKMRQQNGNDWKKYDPRSNVLWLHYLLRKLCKEKVYPDGSGHPALVQMRNWCRSVLKCNSSADFVQSLQLLTNTSKTNESVF